MSNADAILSKLDMLCAQSLWPEVLALATDTPASVARSCALAVQVASVEAELETELASGCDTLDTSKIPKKKVKALLQRIAGLKIPIVPESPRDRITTVAYHLLHAHLLYLRNELRHCIEYLDIAQRHIVALNAVLQTESSDDTDNTAVDSQYFKALVIKHRCLYTATYMGIGQKKGAQEAVTTLEILNQTLKSVPEAAKWAQVLRALEIRLCDKNSPEYTEALEKYLNVCHVSGRSPSTELKDELDALDVVGDLSAFSIRSGGSDMPSSKRGHHHDQTSAGAADPRSLAKLNIPTRSFTQKLHLRKGNKEPDTEFKADYSGRGKQTTFEQQIQNADAIEQRITEKVKQWRQAVKFSQANHPLSNTADLDYTKSLAADIITGIEDTFNSTSLMRQLSLVLLAMGRYNEALAAFDTYVSYQKLQLMRLRAGAPSVRPDNPDNVAEIFGDIVRAIVASNFFVTETYSRVDMVTRLAEQLDEVWPKQHEMPVSDQAAGRALAIQASIFSFQGMRSEGDDYFNNRMSNALSRYEKAFQLWEGSGLACYSYGQILAYTKGPSKAYEFVKTKVLEHQETLSLWHLMILLLTAQQKFDEAIQFSEGVIANAEQRGLETLSISDKKCLIGIKMTHVAALECKFGVAIALDELPRAIEILACLWPAQDSSAQGTAENGYSAHSPAFSVSESSLEGPSSPVQPVQTHRSIITEATQSSTVAALKRLTRPRSFHKDEAATSGNNDNEKLHARLDNVTRMIISEFWLWVGQLYVKADMVEDARLAAQQSIGINGHSADSYTVVAQSWVKTDPKKAWSKLSTALTCDIFSVGAITGRAGLLEKFGRVSKGVLQSNKPSVLFDSEISEMEAYRICLGQLEEISTRNPGRFVPETWYFIGVLCEALGDEASAKKSFWQCVELEEQAGIRIYTSNLLLW